MVFLSSQVKDQPSQKHTTEQSQVELSVPDWGARKVWSWAGLSHFTFHSLWSDLGVTFVQLGFTLPSEEWGSLGPRSLLVSQLLELMLGTAPHRVTKAVYLSSRAEALTSSSASWLS